jgi:hypothetical protein
MLKLILLLAILITSCSKPTSSDSCDRYHNQGGTALVLCHGSGTYVWGSQSGTFTDISDSIGPHWPTEFWYELDNGRDTMLLTIPGEGYDYIYVNNDDGVGITYKEDLR